MPNRERFRSQRSIDREVWLKAGEAGLPRPRRAGRVRRQRRRGLPLQRRLRRGAGAGRLRLQLELRDPDRRRRPLPAAADHARSSGSAGCRASASGEIITAIGMTEPAAGSDLKGIQSTARRDGDGWSLSGSKTFITNGYNADLVVTAARTPDPGGISLFAVEDGMEGFSRGNKLDKLGQHEADTAELFFDEVAHPGREPDRRARPWHGADAGPPLPGADQHRGRQRRPRRERAAADARVRDATAGRSGARSAASRTAASSSPAPTPNSTSPASTSTAASRPTSPAS